jgi:hypothetical protein
MSSLSSQTAYPATPKRNPTLRGNNEALLGHSPNVDHSMPIILQDVYQLFHAARVRNIPRLLCAGDVLSGGAQQCTVTLDIAKRAACSAYSHECHLEHHIHYRLVMKNIGQPLATFFSTKELTSVLYDAVIGVSYACNGTIYVFLDSIS